MRALAVIAVMVFHANHAWLPAGFLGVDVFFVISGYLITLLLIAEHERTGFISLGAFWARRFRRLLPALFVMLLLVMAYCAVFLRDPLGKLRGDVLGAVFYVSNWYQVWSGQGYAALSDFVPLRHLWSLAVEEQFYLFWPLVMIVILRRGRDRLPQIGLWLMGLAVLITIAVAVVFHGDFYNTNVTDYPDAYFQLFGRSIDKNNFLYLATFTRATGILMGAGFAMLWRPLAVNRGPAARKGRTLDVLAIGALVGLGAMMATYELSNAFTGRYYAPLFRGGFLLTAVLTLVLIAAVTHRRSLVGKFLGNRLLHWIGTRSYGLYLFHWPIYQIIRKQAGLPLTIPQFVVAILVTLLITELSYRYVEMPVRRREFLANIRRARPQLLIGFAVAGALTGYASVSLATADVKCTSKIECDNEGATPTLAVPGTGSTDPADTSASVTTVPGESPTSAGGETTTTLAATTTTVARQVIPVLALGESVMKGAEDTMFDNGIAVNAEESRGPDKTLELLRQYREGADITEAVVIQVGTNGPVTQEKYDAIMAEVADEPLVLVLTVKAPKDYIPGNNAIIRALPLTHPNVRVIDWEQRAAEVAGDLSQADGGVHLNSANAVKFYTNLILAELGKPLIP